MTLHGMPAALAPTCAADAPPDGVATLLRARTLEELGSGLVTALADAHCGAWGFVAAAAWPDAIRACPSPLDDAATLRSTALALFDRRAVDRRCLVLEQSTDGGVALLIGDGASDARGIADHPLVAAAGDRVREILAYQRLRGSVAQLSQAEKLQHALFAIADMAGSDLDMPTMLRGLHGIVGKLMYAENFYIAMFDRERDALQFLYFEDTVEPDGPALNTDVPRAQLRNGITWYLTEDGRPLMGCHARIAEQVSGPLDYHGADCLDLLGVPMLRNGEVRGAIVVQSYLHGDAYTDSDRALLTFVADHILTALERKRGQEELERRVEERTRQLAEANRELQQQVFERLRGEHLQATLYRIAALANTDESAELFYRHIHQAVGELINAENFYIALLSEDRRDLTFPYSVDAFDAHRPTRPLGHGMSEYVIRQRRPLLADLDAQARMEASGEVLPNTSTPSLCWLGVPLMDGEVVMGLVAVQSYRPELQYDEDDAELLTFVSYQIASSLQRRNSAEALRRLNADLERRVANRTAELREQIAVREKVEAQLKHQVMHDSLTGLPNRLYLHDRLEREIAGLRRHPERRFALLYLDVDRFKLFNDGLGHLAGDEILREVSRRMSACLREPDVVARLSGDEFAILLVDTADANTACRVAQRVQDALQRPMMVGGRELQSSASIGIAIGDGRYHSIDAVLHDADTALYRAKAAGRARFVLFDETLQRAAMDVLGLEHELRRALAAREFLPYFQPLVRLADSSTIGYEALIRWNHPTRGILTPDKFLTIAEESGLMEAIDWQMYQSSCADAAPLVENGGFITLNISPRHFQNEDFDERLLQLTAHAGFNPARLRIEVTEGTLLGDPDAVAKILERLRAACVEAALDDFGTGYSSLGYVHRFPLKMIKIDRSFIAPLGTERAHRSSAVVGAVLALAHSLGVEVVAEGIETEAQRLALVDMGCIYGQGFLFGRPQPASYWLTHDTTDR